jgi:GxxExxY protein
MDFRWLARSGEGEYPQRSLTDERQQFMTSCLVDTLVPDLLVDGLVLVDPKVVNECNDTLVAQMMGYLAITGFKLAILLNFKQADLRQKRVIR